MQYETYSLAHLPLILQHMYRLAAFCCFRDTVAVYLDDMKWINAVCGHNLDMYNVKAGLQRVTKQLN